jgi:transcriptional regulator with XRE-family HTH domain
MGRIRAAARNRELGDQLKKRREAAGVTGAQVAAFTGWSLSKVSRIEVGRRAIDGADLMFYLGACGIYRCQAMDLSTERRLAEADQHGYWLRTHKPGLHESGHALIFHERAASVSTCYEPQLVPGLLQTESYIRALVAERWPEEDADFTVQVRMGRQEILHRFRPGQFTFFISELALRLVIGDFAVMHEQMLALTLLDALPHVSVRVVPSAATFGGAFRVFEFAEHRPLVYLDAYLTGLIIENKEYVDPYRRLIPVIADAALDEGQSREYVAALANEYDRRSARDRVEEEQL